MKDRIEMWIFDPLDFFVKKVIQIIEYNIKIDEECNSKSIFYSCDKDIPYQELDLVFVKKANKLIYSGIIDSGEREEKKEKITCKDIINIFDEKISILSSAGTSEEYLIKNVGIEDFIKSQIDINYVVGPDYISSRNFITVIAKTHTPLNISVSKENNIYNLATFMINCRQNYDTKFDISLNSEEQRLVIEISCASSDSKKLVDLKDVPEDGLKEIYSSKVLSKVKVLTDSNQYCLFLLKDRTTTDNPDNENIVFGKSTTIYTPKYEDARQTALNQFKANKYEHYFTWKDVKDFNVGEKIHIKTTKGEVLDTYISAKEENSNSTLKIYTCGRLRVKFIDKFLKERYQ